MWDKAIICSHIRDFLGNGDRSVDEYSLIQHLDSHQCFQGLGEEPPNLRLFRKHFITRHCLYTLQQDLAPEWFLDIGMLAINLQRADLGENSAMDVGRSDAALREYYLDLTHLERADAASVEELLAGFWKRFAAATGSPDALAVLELDSSATWAEVQLAYRRKAQRAHPDQGGTAEEFAAVQDAYEMLKQRFGKAR